METLTFKTFLLISENLQPSRGYKKINNNKKEVCEELSTKQNLVNSVEQKLLEYKEKGWNFWSVLMKEVMLSCGREGRRLDYDGVHGGE